MRKGPHQTYLSVFEPQTKADTGIVGTVTTYSNKDFYINGPFFVDVVSDLNFGAQRPFLVLPVIGNTDVRFSPVTFAKWFEYYYSKARRTDVGTAADGQKVLHKRNYN